jgi:chemotaxis response regulator CheB
MGNDGAKGLLKMKTAGKLTIAQDEKSSTVYGMPKVAVELNAVHLVASLHKIRRTLFAISNFD